MPRPDPARLERAAQVVLGNAGETALLRSFVSAAGGTPQYGVQKTLSYTQSVVTGMFRAQRFGMSVPTEAGQAGGQIMVDQLYITTLSALSPRDELIWRGTAYRLDGAPTPENIGGRGMWQSPLVLLGVTG